MATVYYDSSATGANDGTSEADAFTDLQTAYDSLTMGDHLYCKRAASREGVKTTNLTFSKTATDTDSPMIIEGYANTPGDGGMYQTASPVIMNGDYHIIKYFDVDKDDDNDACFYLTGDGHVAYRCIGRSTYGYGRVFRLVMGSAIECAGYGAVRQGGNAIFDNGNRGSIINCYAEVQSAAASAGSAIVCASGFRPFSVVGCVCKNSSGTSGLEGIRLQSSPVRGGVVMNNTVEGFDTGIVFRDGSPASADQSVIAYGNVVYNAADGIKNNQGTYTGTLGLVSIQNAFGLITSAQTTAITDFDPITLTESPFVDTTDYQLNNAPGGGALLKGKLGIPDSQDPSKLTSLVRTDFQTHGGVAPNPVGEVSRSF